MARVQAQDPEAFGVLYDRFGARAYGAALAVVHDRVRAEDVVQDTFLAVWRDRDRYRPDLGALLPWVLGIVRNRAIDSLRRHGRHDRRWAPVDLLDERVPAAAGLEDAVVERDGAARLRATLARLPVAQREVIALAYFGELSTTEIAATLSLPLGTVKGRIRLGLNKLRAEHTEPPLA